MFMHYNCLHLTYLVIRIPNRAVRNLGSFTSQGLVQLQSVIYIYHLAKQQLRRAIITYKFLMEKHYRRRDTIPSDRRGYSCRKNNEIKLRRAFVLIILLNIGGGIIHLVTTL